MPANNSRDDDLVRNNQITESGLDLGHRNRHRSLTHALMIFLPLDSEIPM
jgi:hypothetical protein